MNSLDLLQPHLATIEELKLHLHQRKLIIPNIDNKSKEEVLKIFYKYAVPLHKRGGGISINTTTDINSSNSSSRLPPSMPIFNRRNNNVITSQTDDNNMKTVVRNFERTKIRILEPNSNVQNSVVNSKTYTVFNSNCNDTTNNRKRSHSTTDNNKMVNDDEEISPKRKPITWP